MTLQFSARSVQRGLIAIPMLLLGLAACGGQTQNAAIPTQSKVSTPAKASKILAHMNISRSRAATVMALVRHAASYASPVKGRPLQKIHTMTSAAGMDLAFNGGPTVSSATTYNILVNANDESPWGGQIGQFQNDLAGSNMIHIVDQYTGASGPYNNGGDVTVSYDTSGTLQDQDIYNIVYNVASTYGTGYNALYHVFLQSGVSQCSQNAGGCYGQQYCAYHGNTDYTDIGHVLYSVEPYQGINGCEVSYQPSPNGVVADSTASTLSHETFEAITDPDVPTNVAWYNNAGGEIGDLCAPASGVNTGNVQLGSDTWEIQMEYDNAVHDCSFSP